MLLRPKQDLNSLPHDPPFRLQRRHSRLSESGRVRQRLQTVLTSQALIYKRDASAWRAQEQLIVVAMQFPVEAGELRGREVWAVRGLVVLVLGTHVVSHASSVPTDMSYHSQ